MIFVDRLTLTAFRSYENLALDTHSAGFVVITGPNGSGKTNILEAVSLLAPGRGLRRAASKDWLHRPNTHSPSNTPTHAQPQQWAISAEIQGYLGPLQCGTGGSLDQPRRQIVIQGHPAPSQNALGEHFAALWLTPQMDGLFLGSAGDRRRFLDRMILARDPGHGGRLTRYENAMAQRNRLLKDGLHDPSWLGPLEQIMAETGVALAAARLDFVDRLQRQLDRLETSFPHGRLSLDGETENALLSQPALSVEQAFQAQLSQSRAGDAASGLTRTGPHRSDLSVVFSTKNAPAAQCSTGEQKALLINLIIAFAFVIRDIRGASPVLLLDEVAAHLDPKRRQALFDLLFQCQAQTFITGTEEAPFAALKDRACLIRTNTLQTT